MKKILFLGMACALLLLSFSGIKAQTVILQVDMTYQTFNQVSNSTGNFDYMNDSVDVAGSFNGWSGTSCSLTETENVYETVVTALPGDNLEYKFRINGEWNGLEEFPNGGANRTFTVGSSDTTLFHLYGDLVAVDDNPEFPTDMNLLQNYPNPFNPETNISFQVPNSGQVSLDIYNIKGQKVKTLVNDKLNAGRHTIVWNGRDDSNKQVASGIYLYKLRSGKYSSTKKMILMK